MLTEYSVYLIYDLIINRCVTALNLFASMIVVFIEYKLLNTLQGLVRKIE